jgi:hypothetical protein
MEAALTGDSLEHFTGGVAIGVDVAAIERDLAALWRQAAGGQTSVTRACSWNLVVYAEGDEGLSRTKKLSNALVATVPSRTLILHHRPDQPGPELEAFVTANCRLLPGGGKLVCSEEITVETRGHGNDYLPSLTRALLVPDIPTAVLCGGVPESGHLLQELMGAADRLIVDSHAMSKGHPMHRLGNALSRVVDLAWLRTFPWRAAVASVFDAPEARAQLSQRQHIAVSCAREWESEAKLLVGWLQSRLSNVGEVHMNWQLGAQWSVELKGDKRSQLVEGTTADFIEHQRLMRMALGPRGLDMLYPLALAQRVLA